MTDTPDQPTAPQNPTPAEPTPSTDPAPPTSVVASVGDLAIRGDGVQIEVHGVRADENGRNKDTYAVIDALRKQGLTRMDLKTEPPRHP